MMGILGTFGGAAFVEVAEAVGLDHEIANNVLELESRFMLSAAPSGLAIATTAFGEQYRKRSKRDKRHRP